jgi:hypothetical protein
MIFGIGLIMIIISFYYLFFKKNIKIRGLDIIIILFVLSMILSAFMAYTYWEQPFLSSLIGYRDYYIYFLYFTLIFLATPSENVEKTIKILFFLSLAVFIIDFITFPNPLFAWREEERRNGITILFFGQGFTFLGGFYYFNQFVLKRRFYYFLYFGMSFFGLFFLTQSRMNLIGLLLGSIFIFLQSDFKKKYLVALFSIFIFVLVYYNSDVFQGIKEENKTEGEYYADNVRLASQNFYLSELQGGVPTMIFGNGIPGKQTKLSTAYQHAESYGLYTSDVGLTGIFSYFGVFGVIIFLILFIIVFKMNTSKNNSYLKAYFIVLLTTAFTGYSLFDPGYMSSTILALYLVRWQTSSKYVTS